MITACKRYLSVGLLVATVSGCQSPGPMSSWFAKKEDPAAASELAAQKGQQFNRQQNFMANNPNSPFSTKNAVDEDLRLARKAREEGRLVPARMCYEKVLQAQPRNLEARQGLAVVCDQLGNFREAEGHYRQALELAPQDPNLHSDLGYSYFLQGRNDEASRELQAALEINRNHSTALYNLGLVRGRLGDQQQALALFRQSGVSEQEAYSALAQFNFGGGPGSGQQQQIAGTGPNTIPEEPAPQNMTPEMKKLWGLIQAERKKYNEQQLAMQNKRGPDNRVAAPAPGRNVPGRQATYGQGMPEDPRQQALNYLKESGPNPAEYSQLFNQIDQRAERDLAMSQASSLRSDTRYVPANGAGMHAVQYPVQGGFGAPAGAPAGTGNGFENNSWSAGQNPQPPSGAIPGTPNPAAGAWGQPPEGAQLASGSLPQWNPPPTHNPGQPPLQNVSASGQGGPVVAPRITPRHGNMNIRQPAPIAGGTSSAPPINPNMPAWGGAADQGSPMPAWPQNTPPSAPSTIPAGATFNDDFSPIPNQGGDTSAWGNGIDQTSVAPGNRSGVIQASATMPAPVSAGGAGSLNSLEQARLAAAQMGLNAGAGGLFPPAGAEMHSVNSFGGAPASGQLQNVPEEGASIVPHQAVPRAELPSASVPSAQGMVFGAPGSPNLLPTNGLGNSATPQAMIPSSQGFVYGQGMPSPGQQQMLQSTANETYQHRLNYEQNLREQNLKQQSRLPQWQGNHQSTAPGNAYPQYRPGPRALPTGAELPPNGGFPGR